ncbi:MAG TPA: phosphoribosylformylglycinamidine synthase subunit PurS [Thermodesulfobacteriota bacterium]|nr:phosphoribosylformylglycinamidine synthase subunit PurS [Thermodesulfobacteriota bacterium]
MVARIRVTLKRGVLDPQGKAVQQGLALLGFEGVEEVRIGKYIEVKLSGLSRDEAERRVQAMCERLLANPVIEDFRFEINHV